MLNNKNHLHTISVGDFARTTGLSRKTVLQWCESGKIPAQSLPYGRKTTWVIPRYALELTLSRLSQKSERPKAPQVKDHSCYVTGWVKAMRAGSCGGRPFSERTVKDYCHYVGLYLNAYKKLSAHGLKAMLLRTKKRQYATREHCYKAVLSFAKFLEGNAVIAKTVREEIEALRPKSNPSPTRMVPSAKDIEALQMKCDHAMERAILELMINTGIRVSELCALNWADIDLRGGVLLVKCGKGGKSRCLGLNGDVIDWLNRYQATMAPTGPVFLDRKGQRMSVSGVQQRLYRVAKEAGVTVNCHSLRRYFVTSRAAAGKPLALIQKAAGHSNIKTTMMYVQLSEQAVIDAMRSWE